MAERNWIPQPQEEFARRFRRAHERWDREPVGHYERAGFGYPDGYHGAYAERPGYAMPRGERRSPGPARSGWPGPVVELSPEAEERHARAFQDRDLARSVDFALYEAIGPEADAVTVWAEDAVITLEGELPDPRLARAALDVAWSVPGVRRVRSRLFVRGRLVRPAPPTR